MKKFALLLAVLTTLTALSGCQRLAVYKQAIEQGNVIEQSDIDKLEVGMTRKQVRYVMGTPLALDTFDQNRWDYYYSIRNAAGTTREAKVTIWFNGDLVTKIDGDAEKR